MSDYCKVKAIAHPCTVDDELHEIIYDACNKNVRVSPIESINEDEIFVELVLSEETHYGEYCFYNATDAPDYYNIK